MAGVVVEPCLASSARPPQRIVLDFDDPEAPVHGEQAQARYAGDEGGSCCLPLPLYAGLSGRLSTTIFQAKRFTGTQRLSVWNRLGMRRRQAGPDSLVILRGDSHFAYPEVLPWSEAHANLRAVTGLTSHAVLQTLARDVVEPAQWAYERDRGKSTRFHSTRYQAGPWSRARRVVSTVEVSDQGVTTRCVVTDMAHARTKVRYQQMEWARGQAENERQDHKRYLQSERTSWHRFEAKQVRLFLPSAADG
jgi:Transposase DDE domain group 1